MDDNDSKGRNRIIFSREVSDSLLKEVERNHKGDQEGAIYLGWDEDGLLPYDGIVMTPAQLIESSLVTGFGLTTPKKWDKSRRLMQAQNFVRRAQILWAMGIEEVILSGDFVEDLPSPDGILGYFCCDGSKLSPSELDELFKQFDPQANWSFVCNPDTGRIPMWHEEMVELLPVYQFKEPSEFEIWSRMRSTYHQCSITSKRKGVIKLVQYA